MFDRACRDLHDKTVAACAAVAFENLGRLLRHLDDVAVIHAHDTHPDKCRYGQINLGSIDLRTITRNNARILKFADSLDDGGGGQPNAATELGVARTG